MAAFLETKEPSSSCPWSLQLRFINLSMAFLLTLSHKALTRGALTVTKYWHVNVLRAGALTNV